MQTISVPKRYEKFVVSHEDEYNGQHVILKFPNGYGASIAHSDISNGRCLAVLDPDGEITYSTGVDEGVSEDITLEEQNALLEQIYDL